MLSVKSICKSYKKEILKDISFDIQEGEIIGIIGANGSGKSTLVSIITNNIKADSGSITIDGNNIMNDEFNLLNLLGYVPQENILFNKLTAKQNINFWSKACSVEYNPLYFDNRLLDEKVAKLSGGNKKILSIELALMTNPKYLIMDEPTSALDLVNQQKIMKLIIDYKKKRNSVLFITHHINEIKICDKIIFINNGKIKYFDKPENIFNNDEDVIKILNGGY